MYCACVDVTLATKLVANLCVEGKRLYMYSLQDTLNCY